MRANSLIFNGAPGRIRTPDPLIRSQLLYPTELQAQLSSPLTADSCQLKNQLLIIGLCK